jgi:hypothetical protein
MGQRTLTGDFISQASRIEGDAAIVDQLSRSADTVALPSVAASGAATCNVIRLGMNGPR